MCGYGIPEPNPSNVVFLTTLQTAVCFPEHILFGLRLVRKRFPNKKYVIVLEEGLIVSPDFLFYMAQLVFLFDKDESILAVSAWNPNGRLIFIFKLKTCKISKLFEVGLHFLPNEVFN